MSGQMRILIVCIAITVGYLSVFYIWGRAFTHRIGADCCLSESVCFGFIMMHVIYQVFYLPFFVSRGSYKGLSILWIAVSTIITILCLVYNAKTRLKRRKTRLSLSLLLLVFLVVALIVWLCILVGLHPRYYQDDGYYINDMDRMVYQNVIWHVNGLLDLHHGFNSFFALFGTPCIITGIRPFYIALFTMRFLGVVLTAFIVYRTGKVFFDRRQIGVSAYAMVLSMIASLAMMFWSSLYVARFYWMRMNESKAYCVMVLMPLAFSVCAELFLEEDNRSVIWKKQYAIGLAAVPVAVSSMMSYPMLIIICAIALIIHDRFRGAARTILSALLCVAPNIAYLVVYMLR